MKVFIGSYKELEQKVEIEIDDYDTYSADYTLAKIIEPLLIKFSQNLYGAPLVDNEDVPEELRASKQDSSETDSNLFKRWEWVLNEMIWAFHQKNYDWENQYYSGEHDTYFEDLDNGYSEMKRGPNDTFKIDKEGMQAHQARMNNGFRLFGKYYENLWT